MPIPRIVPALLSFTAGFVDACTFLALFGLYVAQVTGSFVVFGSGLVAHEEGFVIKVLAIPMFFAAGVSATIFAAVLRRRGHAPLPYALALECTLLAAFLALGLTAPMRDANAPATVLAAMLGLSAMGVQSAAVRLLMPGVASTNVMTTNTTLFAIDTGDLLLGWHGKRRGDAEAAAQFAAARERLSHLIPLGIGFFLGTAIGAVAFVMFGLACLIVVLVLMLGLIVWAARS
ncbi:MAG: YoaK family protein [Alphaproteobacteria bacterium]